MLRITTTNCDQATSTFKLEGKLSGPWIGELESACARPRSCRTAFALTSTG